MADTGTHCVVGVVVVVMGGGGGRVMGVAGTDTHRTLPNRDTLSIHTIALR